jgi:hypothetical protein
MIRLHMDGQELNPTPDIVFYCLKLKICFVVVVVVVVAVIVILGNNLLQYAYILSSLPF